MSHKLDIIHTEDGGGLAFGNHTLRDKAKQDGFQHGGDVYKVKTYATMTKLEKNEMFLYESVPGTSVSHFKETDTGVSFSVEGTGDAQITLGMADDTEYFVFVGGEKVGIIETGLGGKLNVSVEFDGDKPTDIEIKTR